MAAKQLILVLIAILLAAAPSFAQEPLTLEQAVQLALDRNPRLRAAADEADAAHARVDAARSAYLPRLDFSQGFTRGNNPVYVFGTLLTQRQFTAGNFALPGLNAPTPLNNFQTRLEGEWTLYDFGRTSNRHRGARHLSTAQDFRTEQERQDLILRVVSAYQGVLVARANLEAARKALESAEANEARVHALEQAGVVVASDLLSAQVHTAAMREREIRAANQLELARLTLGHEIGLGPEALRVPVGSLNPPQAPTLSIEEYEKAALAERPALRAAEMEMQAAKSDANAARSEFTPRISMYASFERDAQTLGSKSGTNWIAGARFDVNLYHGGADKARLAEARAQQRAVENQVEWFRSGVRLEVRQSYLEAQAARQRVEVTRNASAQAEESLRILQNRYEAGLANITDLLRAQVAALDARTAALAALHDWQVARAQLERAAGRLTTDLTFLTVGQTFTSVPPGLTPISLAHPSDKPGDLSYITSEAP